MNTSNPNNLPVVLVVDGKMTTPPMTVRCMNCQSILTRNKVSNITEEDEGDIAKAHLDIFCGTCGEFIMHFNISKFVITDDKNS